MANPTFPAQELNTSNPIAPTAGTCCRKAVIVTVALIAMTALTLALLSHFGCVAVGSIGTICLFTTTGIAALGLAALLARCKTAPSAEFGRPAEPNRRYALEIHQNEAIFTDQENGARFRRPILKVRDNDILLIPSPKSWGNRAVGDRTYALIRSHGHVWAIYQTVENHRLINRSCPNQSLDNPGYNNMIGNETVDPWSVLSDTREVQINPTVDF